MVELIFEYSIRQAKFLTRDEVDLCCTPSRGLSVCELIRCDLRGIGSCDRCHFKE